MILIGRKQLSIFGMAHPHSRKPLAAWEKAITQTNYGSFNQLKQTFSSVDYAAHQYTIFDISGNKYRLISEINYSANVVNIKRIWTHAEYSLQKNIDAIRGNKI
jgi:mRNA interferase HigB